MKSVQISFIAFQPYSSNNISFDNSTTYELPWWQELNKLNNNFKLFAGCTGYEISLVAIKNIMHRMSE